MGCVASKLEEEEEVVSICRERKRQLKLAVERRYTLAEAHCRYCHSLCAVAAAIKLFVARHSSPSSPFLITFPPSCASTKSTENIVNNPMFLQEQPSDSASQEAVAYSPSTDSTSSSLESAEEEETKEQVVTESEARGCGHFYMQMLPPMVAPQQGFGWDFFNPFEGMRPEVISGYGRSLDDDLKAVREDEGIPELEEENDREEEEKNVVVPEEKSGDAEKEKNGVEVVKMEASKNAGQREQKGLTVTDEPESGRELLEALKDIEDHLIKAYDSGNDISRMLEANRVQQQSSLEEIKDNSTKIIQAITWHRSTSTKPSLSKSLVASSSKSSLTWTQFKNDLFDDYGGMASGSHSLTLERLYAWEKKLYEEVKAGDITRKIYEKKCSRLRNQDVRGDDEITMDKTRTAVKDLYARILVAIRSAESISKRIQKLRDEELQPQVIELLRGLMRAWQIMLQCHETQNKILSEVKSFDSPTYGKFCNDSHRLATLQLEAELQNWHACFKDYIAAQKGYVDALHGWLSKFIEPEVEFCSRGRRGLPAPYRPNGPPLLLVCHDWLGLLGKLPDKSVSYALKTVAKDVRALWVQQGEEKQQKRKVDGLAKELDRRVLAFQKAENRILDSKLSEQKPEADAEHQNEYLTGKKEQLDTFRRRLEVEKEKHHMCMQETERITLNGFQTGFSAVFEALAEFSKASLKMYADLVNYSNNAEKVGNLSYIESSQGQVSGGR